MPQEYIFLQHLELLNLNMSDLIKTLLQLGMSDTVSDNTTVDLEHQLPAILTNEPGMSEFQRDDDNV